MKNLTATPLNCGPTSQTWSDRVAHRLGFTEPDIAHLEAGNALTVGTTQYRLEDAAEPAAAPEKAPA
jgi:hypothetical protein